MEITQTFLQNLLADIKKSGESKITYEDLETRLEKISINPEQNAEIYKYLENNGITIIDAFDKDTNALYRSIGDVAVYRQ